MWPFVRRTVESEVRRRRIERLLHSTHLYRNLPQILENGCIETAGGLLAKYGSEKAARFLHDPNRYEKFAIGLDYVNCSLTFPNAELLYHRSKSGWQMEWVHFSLRPALLYKEDTRFCAVSAAYERGMHVGQGHDAFRGLFQDEVNGIKRARSLAANVPTHPQAEVLIHGAVPLSDVVCVFVCSGEDRESVGQLCERWRRNLRIEVAQQLFVWPERLIRKA